jgi:hypothetical protein
MGYQSSLKLQDQNSTDLPKNLSLITALTQLPLLFVFHAFQGTWRRVTYNIKEV